MRSRRPRKPPQTRHPEGVSTTEGSCLVDGARRSQQDPSQARDDENEGFEVRGQIYTSSGPDSPKYSRFPGLISVNGSCRDFNCSALVANRGEISSTLPGSELTRCTSTPAISSQSAA